MLKHKNYLAALIFSFFCNGLYLNSQNIDSLKFALKNAKHDTIRLTILSNLVENESDESIWFPYNEELIKLSERLLKTEPENTPLHNFYLKTYGTGLGNKGYSHLQHGEINLALDFYNQNLAIAEKLKDKRAIANVLINLGSVCDQQGKTQQAIDCYNKALKNHEALGNKRGISVCLNNLGFIFKKQGAIEKALNYFHQSLKIQEEINEKSGVSMALNNIAIIYYLQKDIPKAIEFNSKALKIREEINERSGIAQSLNNIGFIYGKQGNPEKALEYYKKTLAIYEEIKNKKGMGTVLGNIGSIYLKQNNLPGALDCFTRALKIQEEIQDKNEISTSLLNLSSLMLKQGKLNEALGFSIRSLQNAQELGFPEKISASALSLKQIYQKINKPVQAMEMYELYIQMRDSINNQETRKASLKMQFQSEFDKKEAVLKEQQEKEHIITEERSRRQKVVIFSVVSGLILVFAFSIFIFNRLQITRRQKIIIEKQKHEVEKQKHIVDEKQKEILDSITYAKRLQEAILPAESHWLEYLPNSFVLYKPKDIVAGDFYWTEKINDTVFFAAADCTGHGVPGALVSVVCSNALNRTVLEFGITDPGKILDKARELVITTFEKSDKEVKDGMDISLCCLNIKTNELLWSGANNPLWCISPLEDNAKKDVLLEVAPDKQPIGKYAEQTPFTTRKLQLKKGDCIYIFTDGYADQFGGPKGKKFKYKQLKEIIIANHTLPLNEQKETLDVFFEDWRGALEQIDDVCVIGVKI